MAYNKSEFFKRLEKLAELEKRISGTVDQAKDSEGSMDISDVLNENKPGLSSIHKVKTSIPRSIINAILSKRKPIDSADLNSCIDDGVNTTSGHFAKHNIRVSPEEAAYIAIGKKDDSIRESLNGISISDILGMITNKAAVSEYIPEKPFSIDDFDQPKHIRVIISAKSISPESLAKTARENPLHTNSIFDAMEFTLSNGQKIRKNREQAKDSKARLQDMIDDGTIIKIIKILSSGQNKVVYNKFAAETSVEDVLYLMSYA